MGAYKVGCCIVTPSYIVVLRMPCSITISAPRSYALCQLGLGVSGAVMCNRAGPVLGLTSSTVHTCLVLLPGVWFDYDVNGGVHEAPTD